MIRLTDRLDMTIAVDSDVKNQTKPKPFSDRNLSLIFTGGVPQDTHLEYMYIFYIMPQVRPCVQYQNLFSCQT